MTSKPQNPSKSIDHGTTVYCAVSRLRSVAGKLLCAISIYSPFNSCSLMLKIVHDPCYCKPYQVATSQPTQQSKHVLDSCISHSMSPPSPSKLRISSIFVSWQGTTPVPPMQASQISRRLRLQLYRPSPSPSFFSFAEQLFFPF
jgi:hypothetical protein